MFKRDLYELIIAKLNLNTQDVLFKGGYLISIYDGIPYVVDQTTESKFDYAKKEVIPVSEEISQETASVNLADRSDYIFQYQIMFRTKREDKVLTALDEFRTYFFANKQHTIDGYTVAFKVNRGDKQGNIMIQGGWFYSFYKISVYLTAIKSGYIKKDADIWQLRLKDTGSYETLKLESDTFATTGTPAFSSKGEKVVGTINNTAVSSKIRFFYNEGAMETKVYQWIMNKLDRDTLFNFKHTFNSVAYEYVGLIVGGARTLLDNGTVILEFDWIEADV